MKIRILVRALAGLALLGGAVAVPAADSAAPAQVTLTIHADQPGEVINPNVQ